MFYKIYDYIKNKYFDRLLPLSPAAREAAIFHHTCEEIPIAIHPDDLIAGWYGAESEEAFAVTQKKRFPSTNAYTPEEARVRKELGEKFQFTVRFHKAHTCFDYEDIIRNGLQATEKKVLAKLHEEEFSTEQKDLLEGMLVCIDGVKVYTRRFARLAWDMGDNPRLVRIARAMERVPYLPARDFHEAVSAIWIMHSLVPISENSWASVSLGRLDQYLYPYYRQALDRGTPPEELEAILENLYRLLNCYGDGACALNIGGADIDGNDQINDLSRLLIRLEKKLRPAAPILAVRMHPGTPEDIWDSLIDETLFTIGQPTFYNELACRSAVAQRGITPEEAATFSVNSCMGLHMAGSEIASMWGCMYNMHLPLELAINGGMPLVHFLPMALHFRPEGAPKTLEQLLAAYEGYFGELLNITLGHNRKNAVNMAQNEPNPLLSSLTKGCIEAGADRAVSAKYNTETVETMALVNTANAICAIDTLIFQQKKYSLGQFIEAAKNNYEGFELLRQDILACEKYGMNSTYADSICRRLCQIAIDHCRRLSDETVCFLPSLHTLESNVSFGNRLYATLDGRLQGQPVSKNGGPTNDVRTSDPTAMLLSAVAIDPCLFSGGHPIDLYFDPSLLRTKQSRDKIKALLKTYFQLGGLQVHVNSVDLALLEKAYEDPQAYPNVVVRIGGYSRRFIELSRNAQQEFIQRFRQEKGV